MKKLLLALGMMALVTTNVYATGGFECSGETFGGKKVSVYACVPHSYGGLCSDVKVEVDGKLVMSVPAVNVSGFYMGELLGEDDQYIFALKASDPSYSTNLINLQVRYSIPEENYSINTVAAKMVIRDEDSKLIFKGTDIKCTFE